MKFSLKFKFTIFTSALIVFIGVGSAVYFAAQSKKMLEDELKKLGSSFVAQFAMDEEVKNSLLLEQPAFLDTPVNRLRELDVERELAYCRVLLPSGKVFREEKEDWVKINIDDVSSIDNIAGLKTPRVNRFIIRAGQNAAGPEVAISETERRVRLKETFYDFIAPVYDKGDIIEEEFSQFLDPDYDLNKNNDSDANILGYVEIGLSSSKINSKLWRILLTGIMPLSFTTMVVGFGVLYFIARKIIKPIAKLVKMAEKAAKGDLEYRVEVKSNDEIGVLSTSFNKMTIDLKSQMDEKERVMARLQELNLELEDSNRDLTAANASLKEAQEQLIRSEKLAAVGQLAASVAHELRNPIGVIKNSLFYIKRKILKETNGDESAVQLLNIIENESERGAKIISDLLGFTQTSKPAAAPTKIGHIINESLARLEKPDSIKSIVEVDDSLPEVVIDSTQIGQVFINIIQNSYQAMTEGGILTIRANMSNGFVKVYFEDNGPGIPDKFISKVFEPLFTLKANGIGLGLAFSHGVVQRHGGMIEAQSEEGKGTKFIVSLPKSGKPG